MAYLSAENAKTYRALLSGGRFGADVEPGEPVAPTTGGSGSYGHPNAPGPGPQAPTGPTGGPRTPTPPINQPTGYTPRRVITGPVKSAVLIGGDTFTPKIFTGGVPANAFTGVKGSNVESGTAELLNPKKTNFMPFVYIGGAGLLLYYLFKKK